MKKRITISLPENLESDLIAYCEQGGYNKTSVICLAVREHLENNTSKPKPARKTREAPAKPLNPIFTTKNSFNTVLDEEIAKFIVERVCKCGCGANFLVAKSTAKQGNGLFFTRSCSAKYHAKKRKLEKLQNRV